MVDATAQKAPEFAPAWGDLDEQFNDPDNYELEEVFDSLVARQADDYEDLKEPCEEAQELLDQWNHDDDHDYMPNWRAAVARRQPGLESVPDNRLHDAEIRGRETDGLADFLARNATFLLGELWGQRDRRNTQDGDWQAQTRTWGQWIEGQAGDKNTPAWGFSRHPVGKHKAGSAIVLGSSVEGARKAKAMDTMYAMGLDIDSGASLDETLDKVEELGLLCFAYSSYRHGLSEIELRRDEVLRKLQIKGDPTLEQVQTFLREHAKDRYEESFVDAVTIREQKQTASGIKIILDTPPLDKFRLIFPLEEPVKFMALTDKMGTHQAALDLWEDKVTGLARNVLGVHFDVSCTDPSRLFYTARHPKGAENWRAVIVRGDALSFDDIPAMKKAAYTSNRDGNPFSQAGGETAGSRREYKTPSGESLNKWHRDGGKNRFMVAEVLETLCPDKVRHAGGEAQGHVHTECPFEAEHSSEGGTATMAINCVDGQNEYWTWFCHHDACQGRHKLEFLEEALRQNWFDESALSDKDSGFLLEVEDGEDDPLAPLPAELGDTDKTPEERAEAFNTESSEDEIRKFIKKLFREGVDLTVQANVTAVIAKNTNLGRREVKKFWKELEDKLRKRDRDKDDSHLEGVAVINEWGFDLLHEYGDKRIHEANRERPKVFHYARDLCVIREDSNGQYGIHILNKGGFENHLNTVARFARVGGEDRKAMGVAAPDDVVRYLFNDDYGKYPSLRGIITTPSFTASGALLTQSGYDWETKLFFRPDLSLSIPDVSDVPTAEEVFEAKRLLVQEIIADFMLDGMDRAEAIKAVLCAEEVPNLSDDVGEDVYALPVLLPIPGATVEPTPSLAHAIVMAVFPFVRDMISGNAPGIAIDKQKPGAGAGKLEAAMSTIYSGRATPAMALPANPEDMTKVLLPALRGGRPNVFFDNINAAVDSGELASAMTAPTYEARILGKSETVEVEVRCQWVGAGNKIRLSDELIRRFVLIYLDPKTANPEKRTGFRHAEIEAWVRENRPRLVWACLTLVQNWIAGGRQPGRYDKASYSAWARTMGGILDAAGIKGFLGNEKDMKARSTVSDEPVQQLLARLAEYENGQLFVTGSVSKRHPAGTISIKEILEGFHEDEEGDAQSLRMSGWGYAPEDGRYTQPQKLGSGFKRDVAEEPHKVGDWEVSFEAVENSSGLNLWKLVKT